MVYTPAPFGIDARPVPSGGSQACSLQSVAAFVGSVLRIAGRVVVPWARAVSWGAPLALLQAKRRVSWVRAEARLEQWALRVERFQLSLVCSYFRMVVRVAWVWALVCILVFIVVFLVVFLVDLVAEPPLRVALLVFLLELVR